MHTHHYADDPYCLAGQLSKVTVPIGASPTHSVKIKSLPNAYKVEIIFFQ